MKGRQVSIAVKQHHFII